MSASIGDRQLKGFVRKMFAFPNKYESMLDDLMDQFESELLATGKNFASGTPGPNVVTGAYVASLYTARPSRRHVTLQSDAPQSKRLEYGFYGSDSMGRVYSQAPRPHLRPAMAVTYNVYKPQFRSLPKKAWKSL